MKKLLLLLSLTIFGCSHECHSWETYYPKNYKPEKSYWIVSGRKFFDHEEAREYARKLADVNNEPIDVKQYDPVSY